MTLVLDARQRAMLAEMGIRLWAPRGRQAVPTERPPATAAAADPVPAPSVQPAALRRPAPQEEPAEVVNRIIATPNESKPALTPLPDGIGRMDWPELEAAVAACRACGLCNGRTQAVFGAGSRHAEWMVVGEAPGETEDRLGEPFVGQAGKLLDNMLAAIGLSRQAELDLASAPVQDAAGRALRGVYIANVIKCRPPGNRNPEPDEVAQCEPWLRRQVALVQPKIILAMGRFAAQALLQTTEPIGRLRGRVHHYHGVPVVVTYHPAYLLRALPEKAKAWQDLCLALDTFGQSGK